MENIKTFENFVFESNEESTKTLYRLTGKKINAENPGKWYVETESELDPDLLTKEPPELFVVKVKVKSDDVDPVASKKESEKQGTKCIGLKSDADIELVSVEPYE